MGGLAGGCAFDQLVTPGICVPVFVSYISCHSSFLDDVFCTRLVVWPRSHGKSGIRFLGCMFDVLLSSERTITSALFFIGLSYATFVLVS